MGLFGKITRNISNNIQLLYDVILIIFYVVILGIIIIGCVYYVPLKSVAIAISSVVSFILALVANNSFRRFASRFSDPNDTNSLQKEIEKLQQEIEKQESEMSKLNDENRNLRNELDTSEQTRQAFFQSNFCAKVVINEPKYTGYLVKEESLDSLKDNSELTSLIPKQNFWERNITEKNYSRSIFLTQKIQHQESIGFDLGKISFAVDAKSGLIYMVGVQCQVLAPYKLQTDQNDINRCWIIAESREGDCKIKTGNELKNLQRTYAEQQVKLYEEYLTRNNTTLSTIITSRLHTMLTNKYPNLRFLEKMGDGPSSLNWFSLSSPNNNVTVMEIALQMLSGINLLRQLDSEVKTN